MSNHKSAAKQARRSEDRRLRNRYWRARLRTQIKKLRAALTAGDRDAASSLLPETLGLVDRSSRAGVIHDNTAARTKSRLQSAFNRLA
jgi:small subunit ribosomal protein S20